MMYMGHGIGENWLRARDLSALSLVFSNRLEKRTFEPFLVVFPSAWKLNMPLGKSIWRLENCSIYTGNIYSPTKLGAVAGVKRQQCQPPLRGVAQHLRHFEEVYYTRKILRCGARGEASPL